MPWIQQHVKGVTLTLKIIPRATSDKVQGLLGQALKIRLRAPPVEGKANAALKTFLANRLGVPAQRIDILAGATGRHKKVHITDIEASAVRQALKEA